MRDVRKLARPGIMDLPLYPLAKPPEELRKELGLEEIIRLDLNENPLGPSPAAREAFLREAGELHRYPDSGCTALVRALARRLDLDPAGILFDNAADGCISLVCTAFLGEGDEAIIADPTFAVYSAAVRVAGGRPVTVPLRNHVHDLEAMADRIGPRTRLVFVCNPNNPTGTVVTGRALEALLERLPEHALVLLDEAYLEYVTRPDFPNALEHVRAGRPMLVLRSFSKAYGLAGLRIGYLLGSPGLIEAARRAREVFPVSRPAQAAALAALEDEEFLRRVLRTNEEGRRFLGERFTALGLPWIPSQANFICVDLRRESMAMHGALQRRGILIRPGAVWGQRTWARITIGTMEQNRKLIEALTEAFAEVDAGSTRENGRG